MFHSSYLYSVLSIKMEITIWWLEMNFITYIINQFAITCYKVLEYPEEHLFGSNSEVSASDCLSLKEIVHMIVWIITKSPPFLLYMLSLYVCVVAF